MPPLLSVLKEIDFGVGLGEQPSERRVFENGIEAIADLLLRLGEGLAREVPLEKVALNRWQGFDSLLVWRGIVHQVDHVEDGGVAPHGLGERQHEPSYKAEEDALLGGEVGTQKTGEEIVEGLDDAGRDLFLGGFIVLAKAFSVHIEDV